MNVRIRLAALVLASICISLARADTVSLFRDDFTNQLKPGWTILNEDSSHYSISSQGTYHVQTQRGGLGSGKTANNLLLRPLAGNFILETKLQINPTTAQQWGALLVYVDGVVGVVTGLVFVTGTSSTFRGVVALSSTGDPNTANRGGTFYDTSVTPTPDLIWLRMLRNGQQFAMAFSIDGVNYIELKTFENSLIPTTIYVGVGAANGDFEACGSACDTASIPADFDFFEIKDYDGTTQLDPNVAPPVPGTSDGGNGGGNSTPASVTSIAIDGPDRVAPGGTGSYSITATFSDGTTGDPGSITWSVVPPDRATISNGQLALSTGDPTSVTIIAKYTSGGTTRSDYKVVRAQNASTSAGLCAGTGAFSLLPLTLLGMVALRAARR